jgi:hypothetical protein
MVQDVEHEGREVAGAAMHLLALGDIAGALRLLRRACVVHATPEVRFLSTVVARAKSSDHAPAATNHSGTVCTPGVVERLEGAAQ